MSYMMDSSYYQSRYKKEDYGFVAGLAAMTVIPQSFSYFAKYLPPKMHNISDSFSSSQKRAINNAIDVMWQDTGLKKAGVQLLRLPKVKLVYITAADKKFWEKHNRFVIDIINGNNAGFFSKVIQEGPLLTHKNKTFYMKNNSVLLPKKKLLPVGFHELGHAMNYNFSKIGKLLQNSRKISKPLAVIIGLYSLLTTTTPKSKYRNLTTGEKTTNFVRENAGKLAFLAFAPMLIEEGMATLKGQKWANKLLDKDTAKQVFKCNKTAYLSYLGAATFMGLGVWAGVKIKDTLCKKSV